MPIKVTLYICDYCKNHCEKVVQNMEDLEINMETDDIKEIINRYAYILHEAMFDTEKETLKHEEECKFNPKNK